MDGASVRQRIAAARAAGLGVGRPGFPADVQRLAAAHVARRASAGTPLPVVARELGVARATLARWKEHHAERPSAIVPVFRRVEVMEGRDESRPLVVHGPRGVRVEGLDVAQIADLLRRLG